MQGRIQIYCKKKHGEVKLLLPYNLQLFCNTLLLKQVQNGGDHEQKKPERSYFL